MIMGIALLASLKFHDGKKTMFEMGWQRALMIGVAQAVALFPGISRSGSTILAAMILGIKRDDAAKFSFLIYIPAILGAIVLDIEEGLREVSRVGWEILVGFVVAAVTGYLVIAWLMAIIKQARFFLFGYYCLLLSLVLFIVLELT
jgi:undecaprenyl-diphosphatase